MNPKKLTKVQELELKLAEETKGLESINKAIKNEEAGPVKSALELSAKSHQEEIEAILDNLEVAKATMKLTNKD